MNIYEIISKADREFLAHHIANNGYSITEREFEECASSAMNGDEWMKAALIYMMTECNFHTEVKMVENGMYDEARKSLFAA